MSLTERRITSFSEPWLMFLFFEWPHISERSIEKARGVVDFLNPTKGVDYILWRKDSRYRWLVHGEKVALMMLLYGYSYPEDLPNEVTPEIVELGGLLHDIGKYRVKPSNI